MDDQTDQKGLAEYAWVNGIIPDWVYSDVLDYCNKFDNESDSDSVACSMGMSEIYDCYNPLNIYNIRSPVCTNNNSPTAANRRPPSKPGSNRSFFFKYVSISIALFYWILLVARFGFRSFSTLYIYKQIVHDLLGLKSSSYIFSKKHG